MLAAYIKTTIIALTTQLKYHFARRRNRTICTSRSSKRDITDELNLLGAASGVTSAISCLKDNILDYSSLDDCSAYSVNGACITRYCHAGYFFGDDSCAVLRACINRTESI